MAAGASTLHVQWPGWNICAHNSPRDPTVYCFVWLAYLENCNSRLESINKICAIILPSWWPDKSNGDSYTLQELCPGTWPTSSPACLSFHPWLCPAQWVASCTWVDTSWFPQPSSFLIGLIFPQTVIPRPPLQLEVCVPAVELATRPRKWAWHLWAGSHRDWFLSKKCGVDWIINYRHLGLCYFECEFCTITDERDVTTENQDFVFTPNCYGRQLHIKCDYRAQYQAHLSPHVLEAAPPQPSPLACLPSTSCLICLFAYTSGLKQILVFICFEVADVRSQQHTGRLSWMSAVVPMLFPGRWSGARVVVPHHSGRSFSNSLRRRDAAFKCSQFWHWLSHKLNSWPSPSLSAHRRPWNKEHSSRGETLQGQCSEEAVVSLAYFPGKLNDNSHWESPGSKRSPDEIWRCSLSYCDFRKSKENKGGMQGCNWSVPGTDISQTTAVSHVLL